VTVNWSAIKSHTALGRVLRAPLAVIPRHAVVPILSGPNRGFRWCVGSADHGCWLGTYELQKQLALSLACQPGMTALDLGANVGFYTLLLARAVGSNGHVTAIEPDRRNAARLRWHVRLNRLRNVRIVTGAVGAASGAAIFSPGPTHTTGHIVRGGAGEPTNIYRLDDVILGNKFNIPAIVKMDIEGGEAAALAGAPELLAGRRTTWFVALHSRKQASTCIALFRRHGYHLYDLEQPAGSVGSGRAMSELVAEPTRIIPRGADVIRVKDSQ
jgi:FkbM family methyltransferase